MATASVKLNEMHDIGERKIVLGEVIKQVCNSDMAPLKKKEAFSNLDSDSVEKLKEKHKTLGEISKGLWKEF